jgi:membrane peptidoglycan carboxypeptidase
VADAAIRAGIPADTPGMDPANLNLTFVLGTASPSGVDMANSYATFAAQGVRAPTTVVKEVIGPNDGLLFELTPKTQAAFDADTANTVSYALGQVVANGTGTAALALGRPAAAKTGTTDDNKSAWFVGYTPQLATAVLMAKENADGIPVSLSGTGGLSTVTGGSFPAAIWTAFMKAALAGEPSADFPAPPDSAIQPLDCPSSIAAEGDPVPLGCPTPPVVPVFSAGPSATTTLPSVQPTWQSPSVPSPSATTQEPVPSPSATPSAIVVPPPSPPIQEAGPQ